MRISTTASAAILALLSITKPALSFAPPTKYHHVQVRTSKSATFSRPVVMVRPKALKMTDNNEMDATNLKKQSTDPTPFFVGLFEEITGTKANMKMVAAALALALAVMPLPSDAAMSGGRMGGSFSAPSQSRSLPAPSSGYSSGYSRGFTSGYYSRPPSVIVSPGVGFGYSPFFSPFPRPYYGGPSVITYSRGPSFFDLLFFGGFLFVALSIFRGMAGSALGSASSSALDFFDSSSVTSALGSGTSVVQVSVALEVSNRDDPNSILGVLNRLSKTARTDSRVGIQNLTSQVALELLRRRSSIVSASSSYKHFGDRTKAGREFQARSVKERSKFESEMVSRYGGIDYSTSRRGDGDDSSTSGKATMAVVTLVLAIDGDSTKVPRINSISDVEEALRKIASDAKVDDCLQSAEILWTPEDRSETLSLRDVIVDYPELRSV